MSKEQVIKSARNIKGAILNYQIVKNQIDTLPKTEEEITDQDSYLKVQDFLTKISRQKFLDNIINDIAIISINLEEVLRKELGFEFNFYNAKSLAEIHSLLKTIFQDSITDDRLYELLDMYVEKLKLRRII